MSNQADVRSIDAIRDFRVALALFAQDALGALGTVGMEAKRTIHWVQHDRRAYWQEQIKRRREQVTLAKAEVFRRKLQKSDDHNPAMSEQKENLRKAEASLQDAEYRAGLVKKWDRALQQAVFEYQGTTRRISNLAGDVPRALAVLERMIAALEAYVNATSTSGPSFETAAVGSVVAPVMAEDEAEPLPNPDAEPVAGPPEDKKKEMEDERGEE